MAGCPLARKPDACARRQSWTPMSSDCRVCDFRGRKAEEEAKVETPRKEPPVANETTRPKEVNVSTKVTPKEKILAAIQRKGPCVSTPILQCCSVKAEELHRYVKELESEGKIKTWADGKKTFYTVAGAPDPRLSDGKKGKVAPPKSSATPPIKSRANVPPEKKKVIPRVATGGNEKDVIGAAIAGLERRRELIDRAIEGLREVIA